MQDYCPNCYMPFNGIYLESNNDYFEEIQYFINQVSHGAKTLILSPALMRKIDRVVIFTIIYSVIALTFLVLFFDKEHNVAYNATKGFCISGILTSSFVFGAVHLISYVEPSVLFLIIFNALFIINGIMYTKHK